MADTVVSACGHADFREHIPPRATNDGVIIRLVRNCALGRMIQYSREFRD
jgi:hypothetical protein